MTWAVLYTLSDMLSSAMLGILVWEWWHDRIEWLKE